MCLKLTVNFHDVSFISCLQVNTTDVSDMGHTQVVNLVRAAPCVVDLVVGRLLEAPKPPIEAHLLPDICFKGSQEPLGKKPLSLINKMKHCRQIRKFSISNLNGFTPCSVTRFGSRRRHRQCLRRLVCERHPARFSSL